MEELIDGQRDHYPYRPSTIVVFTIIVQIAAIKKFQMDGFSTKISLGYDVQERNLQ